MDTISPAILAVLLVALIGLAGYDAFFVHIRKLELFRYPDTRREHGIHIAHTVVAPALIYCFYVRNPSGPWLWCGVLLISLNLMFTFLDAAEEISSRRRYGGLSRLEYCVHLGDELLKGGLVALTLASKPAVAWEWDAPALRPHPTYLVAIAWALIVACFVGLAEHVIPLIALGREQQALGAGGER